MSAARRVIVGFPVVRQSSGATASLSVERLESLDNQQRFFMSPGVDVLEVLLAARASEPAARRLDGVIVRFESPMISGDSYGLALAIADRRLRYGAGPEAAMIIATGDLVKGGGGVVGRIDGFEHKVEAVAVEARARPDGVAFVCPQQNLDAAGPETRATLDALVAEGRLRLYPARHVDDVAQLWRGKPARTPVRKPVLAAIAVGVVAGLAIGGFMLRPSASRLFCEQAFAAVAAEDGGTASAVRRAAETCQRALDANPERGRLYYLLGQIYALDGGENLANGYWRRAAELGDRDGMAEYGRHIWLSDPKDPAKARDALMWLGRAADAGSWQAMETAGYLLMDGQALPQDIAAAEKWMARASDARGQLK